MNCSMKTSSFLAGLWFVVSALMADAATMSITTNPGADVTVRFALGSQGPDAGPVQSTFTFQAAKGVVGPSSNPASQTGFANSAKDLFAVSVSPATKTAFAHIFLTGKGPQQIFISDMNARVSKLLPQPWRDGAKYWLRIEKLQGRKIKFQTIDFSHAPFQTHDFWVKVDAQGGLTLVP